MNIGIASLAGIGATTTNTDTKNLIIKAIIAIMIVTGLGINKKG